MRRSLWLSVVLVGCGSAPNVDTGLLETDAAVGGDAGLMVADAGLLVDAGSRDAGAVDAGVVDAGARDAGVPDAGVRDAGAPLPNRRRRGSITLQREGFTGTAQLEAFFIEEPLTTPECSRFLVAGCSVSDCRFDGGFTTLFANAGVLSVVIRDAGVDAQPLRNNFYQVSTGLPFESGALARVEGSGGVVPPFLVEQPLPQVLDFEEGGCGSFGCDPISRDAGLTVSWDGGPDEVVVSLTEQRLSGVSVSCRFPGTARTGRLGPAVLGLLEFDNVMVDIGSEQRLLTDAGVFPLEVVFKSSRPHPRNVLP